MSGPGPVVLIIEDDAVIRRFLRAGLEPHGFQLVEAAAAAEGIHEAAMRPPELVLLDLGLPDADGVDVVRRLREWSAVPVIVLSARGQEMDKVRVLDAGADDYVTKPFAMGELLARMRAALRRAARTAGPDAASVAEAGDVRVDLAQRTVSRGGVAVRLTPREYKLLAELARHPGRVLTHDVLLRAVWGPAYVHQHHYLRVYMAQLRHKLEHDPSRPRVLLTETGVGYRFGSPEG